jgi:hypothetical protein
VARQPENAIRPSLANDGAAKDMIAETSVGVGDLAFCTPVRADHAGSRRLVDPDPRLSRSIAILTLLDGVFSFLGQLIHHTLHRISY